ncbi:hypothetical protein L1280_001507 [Deinococcus sp. HSC-46F16]|uniref:hypothetical protein n=1 Tax=Deinococcus sp. HSC-46F16 TaxID=2910968 RepID=UPI00209D79EE|nr:hypothetical protein [Deinococcus sp. HSC-46F16]MCP2014370.1 hypothetical protein [Deinococcus sp. HSC-46F16]
MIGLLLLGVFLGTMAFFAARQARLNRAMNAVDRPTHEVGHVGPSLPGPGGTTGL